MALSNQAWLEILPVAAIVTDADGRVLLASAQAVRMFGYTCEELTQRRVSELIPGLADVQNATARRKDGTEISAEIAVGRIGEGDTARVCIVIRDVTEQKQAEAMARDREARLDLIFNNVTDFLVLLRVEADGSFTTESMNRAAIAYVTRLGSDGASFIGKDFKLLLAGTGLSEEEIEERRVAYRNAAQARAEAHYVREHDPRQDATEVRIYPVLDGDGRCTHILSSARVITDRVKAEEELRKRERELAEAQSIGHIGSWTWEIPEDKLVWSDEVYRILGLEPGQVAPKQLPEFLEHVHPEDRARVEREVWSAFEERRSHDIEHRIVRPDGSVRIVHTRSVIQMDEAGRPIRLRATMHDVTEERQAEEHLRENQKILEEAQHMAHLGSFYSPDAESGRVEWSPEWYRIFELDPADGEPRIEEVLSRTHPDDRAFVMEQYEKVRTTECDSSVEQRLLMPDGRIKYVVVRGSTKRGPDGRLQMRGTLQDITARKIAEEERADLQERLAQAQKMESIGRLAGGVAHDFNNMLTVILGYTAMSKGPVSGDPTLSHNLTEIAKAANRAKEITEKLLGFSRQQIISPVPSNLNDLIEDLRDPLGRLIGEDVELVFHPGADVWTVVVDHSQVNQILLNLVVNARDAMPKGGRLTIGTENVELSEEFCRREPGARPGPYVQLSVSDTGTGMDEQTLSHIFEPFFTTKGQDKGTGLGLATVYGIARQNEGFVTVDTALGHGTTFRIYLPKIAAPSGGPDADAGAETIAKGEGTILLAEDDELVREMTQSALEMVGYDPLVARTPREAIELCRQKGSTIRLLLTDVVMPGMNGMELRERIREINPGIKALFMSGYTSDVIVTHGVLKKGVHFIQKPFTMEDLARRIQEVLGEE